MSKWEMVRLGDYITQVRGVSYSPSDVSESPTEEHIPILRANNIQNSGLNFKDLVYVRKNKISSEQFIRDGDIVICTSSGSKKLVGKAAQSHQNYEVSFGAFCKVIRVNNAINSNFLGHFFRSSMYRQIISSLSSGANINNLRNEHFADLKIPLPPLEEQRRIAESLDLASSLIEKRKKQIELLDVLAKSLFVEMFGDPVENPMGWDVKYIENVCSQITDGEHATPQRVEKSEIYLLSARNILNHSLQLNDVDYIDEAEYDRISRRIIPETNDILISCSGSVGRVCRVPLKLKFQMVRSVAILKPNEMIDSIFFEYQICTKYIQNQILSSINQSSQANLFQGKIRKLTIILPPIINQKKFAKRIRAVETQKSLLQNGLEKLEMNYKALMQKYFEDA